MLAHHHFKPLIVKKKHQCYIKRLTPSKTVITLLYLIKYALYEEPQPLQMRIFIWAVVCLLITISLKRLQTICLEGSLGMLVWDQRDFIRSDNISLVGEIYGLAV